MALHLTAKELRRLTGQQREKPSRPNIPSAPTEREKPQCMEGATHRLTRRIDGIILPLGTEAVCTPLGRGQVQVVALYGIAEIRMQQSEDRFKQFWEEVGT